MEKFLSISRWILHKLFIVLLGTTVWFFIPALAFSINFTNPEQVKTWLSESNSYENFLDESLSFIEQEGDTKVITDKTKVGGIDSRALIVATRSAIPIPFMQEQIESVIDGSYAWLRSDVSQPEFSFSLNEKSAEIEKALTAELTRQIKELPACTTQAEIAQQAQADLLEVTCLPPGVSATEQAATFASDFVRQEDGPVQTVFTQDDLELGNTTKTYAPVAFSSLELLPTLFWSFLFAFSIIVLLTSRSLQRGLREVGTTLMVASGILVAISFVTSRLASAPGKYLVDQNNTDTQQQAAENIIEPLAKNITADVSATAMQFSLIVLGIGLVTFLIGWYLRKQSGGAPEKENDTPELLKDNETSDFIHKTHEEKNAKPKIREKIKKKLIQ